MNDATPRREEKISPTGQPAPTGRSVARTSAMVSAATELWEEAKLEAQSRRGHLVPPSREWFERLPAINRQLLGSGALCAGLGLFLLIGVPILGYGSSAVQTAVHPFTADGKRESCLSRLQQVSAALAQYRSDYDDKFPLTEYKSGQERKTWMAVLRERGADPASFICSTFGGSSDGNATGSYGFNPVLASRRGENLADSGQVLLLADRSDQHDSILLPPFVGWPQVKTPGSIDERHYGESGQRQAAILYADGHVGSQAVGDQAKQARLWGGSALFTVSLRRLETQHPVLKQVATQSYRALADHQGKLRAGLEQLRALQEQCRADNSDCETVEKRAWKGADVLRIQGDGSIEKQMTADLNKHSQQLFSQVSNSWNEHESETGFTVKYPGNWQVEQETSGRYRNTFLRSGSPYISVLIECGERAQPTNATTIDWTGMEQAFKKQYGNNYKRIAIGRGVLDGRLVSVWECELKKPDGPRLRKRYLGYSTTWRSVIVVTTAPSGEWERWNSVWTKIKEGVEIEFG